MDEDESTEVAYRRTAKCRQFAASFLVSLLALCMGSTWSWTSQMQPLLTSINPPVGTEPMTEDTVAWLGSLCFIGSIIGTFFWGTVTDRYGRKMTSCLVAIPFILSWILVLLAQNTAWLIVARLIAGIGNNGATVIVPIFISEISQDNLRGFFGSFFMMFTSAGILFSNIIGPFLSYQGFTLCCMLIPILFFLAFVSFPETPIWLWQNGQYTKAKMSLLWYRGGDLIVTETDFLKYSSLVKCRGKTPSLKALVATKGASKALVIGIACIIAFQASGILVISSYSVSIFEMCGTTLNSYQSAIVISFVQFLFSFLCSPLVDRVGRKVLLIGGLLTIFVSFTVLGNYLFFLAYISVNSILRLIPIIALSTHLIAFAVGTGPLAFIVIGEIFPPEASGLASAKLQFLNCWMSFATVKYFPTIKTSLGVHGYFWCHSVLCFFTSAFLLIYLPETKGKSQSEILEIFNKNNILMETDQPNTAKRFNYVS